MKKSTILFTGATSGFGRIAACKLANSGSHVIAASRSEIKGKALLDYYKSRYPNGAGTIEILDCDLASLESTANACRTYRARYDKPDSIILNAGVMNSKFRETADGIEETFQVNLLAPILMTHLLSDLLSESKEAKILITSSGLHKGKIRFDDIEFRKKYVAFKCYSQSKLGVILFTRLMATRPAFNNIGVYSLHPGVVKSNLGHDFDWFSKIIFSLMGTSPEKGARTLLHLATEDKINLESGGYYDKGKIKKTTAESYDLEVAEKLLRVCKNYLKNYISTQSDVFI